MFSRDAAVVVTHYTEAFVKVLTFSRSTVHTTFALTEKQAKYLIIVEKTNLFRPSFFVVVFVLPIFFSTS